MQKKHKTEEAFQTSSKQNKLEQYPVMIPIVPTANCQFNSKSMFLMRRHMEWGTRGGGSSLLASGAAQQCGG